MDIDYENEGKKCNEQAVLRWEGCITELGVGSVLWIASVATLQLLITAPMVKNGSQTILPNDIAKKSIKYWLVYCCTLIMYSLDHHIHND